MKPGDVLLRPDNANVVLVLEVRGDVASCLYLDNVDAAYVGTTFDHPVDYLERRYARRLA